LSARIATLRLARREIRRHKWRSLLIVLLIVVPVAAATGVDIAWRTSDSVQLQRERIFGGADAIIGLRYSSQQFATIEAVRAALPAGSRVVERTDSYTTLSTPGHRDGSDVLITDHLGDPMLRNKAQLLSGRTPTAPDEAVVTPLVADRLGLLSHGSLRHGSTVTVAGYPPVPGAAVPKNAPAAAGSAPPKSAPIKVVGLIRKPFCLDCRLVLVLPGSPLDTAGFASLTEALAELPRSYRGPAAKPLTALSALGVSVARRDNPATWPAPAPPPEELMTAGTTLHPEHHRQVDSLVSILVLAEGLGLLNWDCSPARARRPAICAG
jgi:putative ABC transport system permease protein